jgi:hypothetical protein
MLDTFRRGFKPAFEFTLYLLKTSWYWILAFHLFFFSAAKYFEQLAELNSMSSQMVILCRLTQMLCGLTVSLFLALLIPGRFQDWKTGSPPRSLGLLIKKYTVPLTLEGIRVFVKVLLWSLLFVLPGIFQYWRLSLVPFIVMLNPDYDKGRLDALKHSHNLIRGHDFGWVLTLVFLALLDSLFEIFNAIVHLPPAIEVQLTISLLFLPLSLYSYALLVQLYALLEQKFASRENLGGN